MSTSAAGAMGAVRDTPLRTTILLFVAMGIVMTAAACSNKQRLPEYDFRDRTVALIAIAPPRPEILSGISLASASDDPVERVIAAGSAILVEVSARNARPRLESAASAVNVRDRMGDRVLDAATRHLRANAVDDPADADFEIEVRIHRYGITASSWSSDTHFLIDAELYLLDGDSGRRIWKSRVRETTPVRPLLASGDRVVDGAVSAITLSNMSTEEIARHLESLADFCADRLIAELVRALDETRG